MRETNTLRPFVLAACGWLLLFVLLALPGMFLGEESEHAFRWSTDWIWWSAFLLLLRPGKYLRWVLSALTAILMVLWAAYQAYYLINLQLYGDHPNLINDLVLAWEVLPLFVGQFIRGGQYYALLAGAAVIGIFLLGWL